MIKLNLKLRSKFARLPFLSQEKKIGERQIDDLLRKVQKMQDEIPEKRTALA